MYRFVFENLDFLRVWCNGIVQHSLCYNFSRNSCGRRETFCKGSCNELQHCIFWSTFLSVTKEDAEIERKWTHFLGNNFVKEHWSILIFFTEIYSCDRWKVIIGLDDGLVPNKPLNHGDPVHRHIHAAWDTKPSPCAKLKKMFVIMMTSSYRNIFRVTGLCEEIPLTMAGDAELWRFLWSAPEQTVEQTIETQVIWDTIAFIMTSLYCVLRLVLELTRVCRWKGGGNQVVLILLQLGPVNRRTSQ